MKRIRFDGSPAKAGITLALTGVLAACGGGGGGGGGSSSGGGGGGGGDPMPRELSTISPATFDSEETVALLAPGSVYGSTVGMTAAGLSLFGALGDVEDSRVVSTKACSNGGQVAFLGRGNQDLDSPYYGGLFDVVATDDQNCQEGDLSKPTGLEVHTQGERRIGYPLDADPTTADSFVAYERSGVSLDKPYSVEMRTNNGAGLQWSRYWDGHVAMLRGSAQGSQLGDGGGKTRLYQVSRIGSGGRDGFHYDVQTGTGADDRFQMRFEPIDSRSATKHRTESYSGVFGWRVLNGSGQALGGDCPAGRYQVQTSGLTVDQERDKNENLFVFGDAQSIVSGSLTMTDGSGNTAEVEYNGNLGNVEVTLNGGTAKTFTYQQLNDALLARCFPSRG